FSAYSFCKAIGWSTGGRSYTRLRESLTRLQTTSLQIYSARIRQGVGLSMLPKFQWKDPDGNTLRRYRVTLPYEMFLLFQGQTFTLIEWEQRLSLPEGLATWLHAYYASH